MTGDALSCKRALGAQMRAAQGDDLFVVKANPPTLLSEVAVLFAQPPPDVDGEGFEAFTVAFSHGRHGSRHEERRLWASAALNAYLADLGWPSIDMWCDWSGFASSGG